MTKSFSELNNKILLGNSYELVKCIPDKYYDLIIIDPPYKMEPHDGGELGNRPFQSEINKLSEGIDMKILDELVRISKKVNIYIFCNKNQLRDYFNYFYNDNYLIDLLIWHKTNPIPRVNNIYLADTEYILFVKEKNVPLYTDMKTGSKVFTSTTNVNDKKLYEHPTIKPESLIEKLIKNSSKEGDKIFDCFSGSGTTCVVAKRMNRVYTGIEIEKKWYDISLARLEGLTVIDMKLKEKGQMDIFSFNKEENDGI